MNKINLRWILYAVLGIIVLRAGGIISNFWLGVGVAGLVVIFALIQELPGYKRLITILFAAWILFCIAAPPLIKSYEKEHRDFSESFENLSDYQELMAAIKADPKNGKIAEAITLNLCRKYEEHLNKWYINLSENSLKYTEKTYPADGNKFPWLNSDQLGLLEWPEKIREERENCDKIARLNIKEKTDKETEKKESEDYAKNIFAWFGNINQSDIFYLIGIAIIIIILINFFAKKGNAAKKAINGIAKAILFVALLFFAYHLILGDLGVSIREKIRKEFKMEKKWRIVSIGGLPKNTSVDIRTLIPKCHYYGFQRNYGNYEIVYSDGRKLSHRDIAGNQSFPVAVIRINGDSSFFIDIKEMDNCM